MDASGKPAWQPQLPLTKEQQNELLNTLDPAERERLKTKPQLRTAWLKRQLNLPHMMLLLEKLEERGPSAESASPAAAAAAAPAPSQKAGAAAAAAAAAAVAAAAAAAAAALASGPAAKAAAAAAAGGAGFQASGAGGR